jgi:tRNA(His) 5'-end guanylyltransferase
MKSSEFEALLRSSESFHSLRIPPQMYAIVRIDGHGFSKFLANYEKPYDDRVHIAMCSAMYAVFTKFQGIYGYTQSDEISILLRRDFADFNRSLEKVVSLSASLATSSFVATMSGYDTIGCKEMRDKTPHFDSRVWIGALDHQVVDYFRWRQADCMRNCVYGWTYWTLVKKGMSRRSATKKLHGVGTEGKHEILHQEGVKIDEIADWQKNGTGIAWREHFKSVKSAPGSPEYPAHVARREAMFNWSLPIKDDYSEFIRELLAQAAR